MGPGDFEDVFVVSVHWTGVPNVCKVEIMASQCVFSWLEIAEGLGNETNILDLQLGTPKI